VALEGPLSAVIEEAYEKKARGEDFYFGPHCPPDVQHKAALEAAAQTVVPYEFSEADARPLETPGIVVDDEVQALSRGEDVEENDFGELSPELSVVTDMPEHGSSPAASEPSGKTILVVDDEGEIRKLLVRLLTRAGHHVIEADRGLVALRLVKERQPDLIVLDAMLPEIHGFEIARRIKGSQRYGQIPIIMVSAVYRGWRYAEDLKTSLCVDHFIEKPFRIAEVVAAVEACLRREAPAEVPDVSGEAEAALNAGVDAYKAGRLDEAIDHLKRGIGIDPLAYRLHFHLGLLYGKKGRVYDAVSELETAVEVNSRHFPAVKNLAILYQKAGFRNKAVEMWERALSLAPDEETKQSIREHLLNLL